MSRRYSPTDDLQDLRAFFDPELQLSSHARVVAAVLVSRRNGETGRCDPSVSTMAEQTSISERQVYRALHELEAIGCITRNARPGRSTAYQIHPRPTPAPQSGVTGSHGCQTVIAGVTDGQGSPAAQSPKRTNERAKERRDVVNELWTVFVEEMDGQQLTLTKKRRKKLEALHAEQLEDDPDPPAALRRILQAVKSSEHHMSNRDYQMPESLFRNEERRERWALKAMEVVSVKSSATMSAAELREWEEKL